MSSSVESLLKSYLPDPRNLGLALDQLIISAENANSVAPEAWGVTSGDDFFRLNVGLVEVLVVDAHGIRLNCAGSLGKPPFVGGSFESTRYKSVKIPACAFVGTFDEFAGVQHELQTAHRRFIEAVGRTRSGRPVKGSVQARSHSEALMSYAETYARHRALVAAMTEGRDPGEEHSSALLALDEEDLPGRQRCLAHHGNRCAVCGFVASDVYGEACSGLEMEVLLLRPRSELGKDQTVNSVRDFRPVCPNCSAASLCRKPSFSVSELIALRSTRRESTEPG